MNPDIIQALKGPPIGVGIRSFVYAVDDEWVVKQITDECDGFWAIVYTSDKARERYGMPRIDIQRSCCDECVIVVEKLFRIDYSLFEGACEAHMLMNDLNFRPNPNKFVLSDHMEVEHPLYEITLKAYNAYKFFKRIGFPVSLDLSPSNIMARKDGTLVLSDPFGYLDI